MKKPLLALALMLFGFLSVATAAPATNNTAVNTPQPAKQSNAVKPTIHVNVKGMVCDFCARGLERMFKKRAEVDSMDVDLANNLIALHLKNGQTLNDEVIHKIVTDNGIAVTTIHRTTSPATEATKTTLHTKANQAAPEKNIEHTHDHQSNMHSKHQ
ncbi:MAG: hypothetical protein AAGF06_08485 [Pseudomonadota bacterium]